MTRVLPMLADELRGSAPMCGDDRSPSVEGTYKRRCAMMTRLFTRWIVAAALAASAIVLAACGGSGDKAGGAADAKPRVLTMANPNESLPAQLVKWAKEVERLSEDRLAIEFKNGWRLGEPRYEAATLKDLQAGKTDMAWVGARAFDTVGVSSFQALVAPLLIDSYELEAEVFE
jgi:TRAP-type C4-dicarboxylate transport system substrate-binding protein